MIFFHFMVHQKGVYFMIILQLLILLIVFFHIYFFILESFLYTGNKGKKIFNLSEEMVHCTKGLAFNQGFYNLCLGLGLLFGLYLNNQPLIISLLFFVVVVGIVGAFSFSKRIFWIQAFPAIVALLGYAYIALI